MKRIYDITLEVEMSEKQFDRLWTAGDRAEQGGKCQPTWVAAKAYLRYLRRHHGVRAKLLRWTLCRNADDLKRRGP